MQEFRIRFVYITVPHAMLFFSLSSEHFECVRHTKRCFKLPHLDQCVQIYMYRLSMYFVYLDEQVHLFHTINCIFTCSAKQMYRIARMASVFGSF